MFFPNYIEGTSLFGYMNQTSAVNAYPFNVAFKSDKGNFRKSTKPRYIESFLIETYTFGLAENIQNLIPSDAYSKIIKNAEEVIGPFSPAYKIAFDALMEKELKYCPECIKKGEHYTYQQTSFETHCRKHGIALKKGCPICGKPIPYLVDITTKDAFFCPSCNMRYTDPSYVRHLLTDDIDGFEHAKNDMCYSEKAYIVGMTGSEKVFETPDFQKFVKEILLTGHFPKQGMVFPYSDDTDIDIWDVTKPYMKSRPASGKRHDLLVYIAENELYTSSSEERAAAFLARMFITCFKINTVDINNFRIAISDIQRNVKRSCSPKHIDMISLILLKLYVKELHGSLVRLFEEHMYDSLLLLLHLDLIPDVRPVAIVVVGNGEFKVFPFIYTR